MIFAYYDFCSSWFSVSVVNKYFNCDNSFTFNEYDVSAFIEGLVYEKNFINNVLVLK